MEESFALARYCRAVKTEDMSAWVFICVDSFVVLEKLFEQRSYDILMLDDVVKGLNNAFVVVSEPMRVGVSRHHPETPIFVHLRVLAGECWFADRCRDPDLRMLEEERSWELTIASAGLDGPGGEVVAEGLGQQVGVEFRSKELSVHGRVLAFVFTVILLFDLHGLRFNLSGLSYCTHPKM